MITKQIGYDAAGNLLDYATPQLLLAAFGVDPDLPLTMADDVTIEIWYSDALMGTIFVDAWIFPHIIQNDKKLLFKGMYGSSFLGTAPKMLITIGNYGIDCGSMGGFHHNPTFENLELDATVTINAVRFVDNGGRFVRCYMHGTTGQNFMFLRIYFSIEDCAVIATPGTSYAVLSTSYNGINYTTTLRNTLIVNLRTDGGYAIGPYFYLADRCTIISKCTSKAAVYFIAGGADNLWLTTNSIITGAYSAFEYTAKPAFYLQTSLSSAWVNNCFYGPNGTFSNTNSLATYYNFITQNDLNASGIIEADPLFVNFGGSTPADYALQSNSPCRALQKTAIASILYPAQNKERWTSGACPYGISNDEILTTSGGNWTKADKNYVVQGHNFGVGGTSEVAAFSLNYILSTAGGNWIDVNVTNVRNGTQWGVSGTSKIGLAYIPSAGNVRFGVNIDATTGTCYVPTAANVRFGVSVDVSDTGLINVPDAASVLFGVSVDQTTGLWHDIADIDLPKVFSTVSWGVSGSRAGTLNLNYVLSTAGGNWFDVLTSDLSGVMTSVTPWGIAGSRQGTLALGNVLSTAGGTWIKADKNYVMQGHDFGVNGTSEVAAFSLNYILSTAGGNWVDVADVDLPKVFSTVTWGISGSRVGTLSLDSVLSTAGGNWADIADIDLPKVFSTVTWGVSGSRVGTLSPNNVLNTVGGNWYDVTDLSKVFDTMLWGVGGTSRQGTFIPGLPPAIPHLTFTDNLDGSGATATITVSDASAINRVYTAAYGSGSWTLSGTRTGNGTVNCSLLTGYYWGYLTSSNPNGIVSTIVLLFSVTSPTDPYTRVVPEPFSEGRELPSEPFTFYWYLGELNDTAYGDPEEILCELNYQDIIICTIDRTGEKTAMEFKNLNLYAKNNKTYLCYVKDRTLTAVNLTGAVGIFTVKVNKSDVTNVFQKRTDVPAQGTIGVAASGEMYFFILPADTTTLNVGQQYVFDIKVVVAGKYYTVSEGVILIKQPVNIV